jgi:hypothetical protein
VGIQAGDFFDNRIAVLISFGFLRNEKSTAPELILVLGKMQSPSASQFCDPVYMRGDVAYEITGLISDWCWSPLLASCQIGTSALEFLEVGSATGPELGRFQPAGLARSNL